MGRYFSSQISGISPATSCGKRRSAMNKLTGAAPSWKICVIGDLRPCFWAEMKKMLELLYKSGYMSHPLRERWVLYCITLLQFGLITIVVGFYNNHIISYPNWLGLIPWLFPLTLPSAKVWILTCQSPVTPTGKPEQSAEPGERRVEKYSWTEVWADYS